jgi:hypothetical protein
MSLQRLLQYAILVLLIVAIVTIGASLVINHDTVIPPHIERQQGGTAVPAPSYTFPFEQVQVTLTSPVDSSVYAGAKAADKETIIRGNVSEGEWMKTTYLSMIDDPAQEQFYTDLLASLESVRDRQGLSDDEYLELITVFVQSIRYETTSENPPKFPVETYVDASGDCDDKSLLLAGLLSREGYQVALLSFTPESHMAVGVVCPGVDYKGTGYAYVETTNLSFVGVPTETLNQGVVLWSDPVVIPVGNGTKTYTSCKEGLYLNAMINSTEQDVNDLTTRIDSMKRTMDAYYAKRDAGNYNLRVPIYNDLQKKRLQYAELHNYIISHQYDRKGTYEYVNKRLPA